MNTDNKNNLREGFHHVEILLDNKPESIKKIYLPLERSDDRIEKLIEKCGNIGLKVEFSKKLKKSPVVEVIEPTKQNLKDLKKTLDLNPSTNQTFIVLDNIIDPRNLGACIRSAAVTDVDAVIINKYHCAPLNDVAHAVSAGGAEYVKTFYVSNLVNCIRHLKKSGINVFGLSEHAKTSYLESDFLENSALIMGSEEFGLRKKTVENCDNLIKLNSNKNFKSFNVSVATGIILSELSRQRKC